MSVFVFRYVLYHKRQIFIGFNVCFNAILFNWLLVTKIKIVTKKTKPYFCTEPGSSLCDSGRSGFLAENNHIPTFAIKCALVHNFDMDLQKRTYSTFPIDCEQQSSDVNKRKWPASFWFILKVLGLFYHKSLVTERKCFRCQVRRITKNISLGKMSETEVYLDPLNLSYELNSTKIARSEDDHTSLRKCEVCETLWWNSKRIPKRYTDREIGN